MSNRKSKKLANGRFAGVPVFVIESETYARLTLLARSLLYELCTQYSGRNNGYLSLTRKDLALRGFVSPPSTQKAVDELIGAGLIMKTRQGGIAKGRGGVRTCNLYAIAWYEIDETLDNPLDNTQRPYGRNFRAWFEERTTTVPVISRK